MDINAAFKQELTRQKKETAPRTILLRVDKEPKFSPTNPDVFQVIGTVVGTGEPAAIITVKGSATQIIPKVGDVIRADKTTRDPNRPNVQAYQAPYFHTYEQSGLCLKALMQPMPVRKSVTGNGFIGAQVHAHDPSKGGVIITGDRIKEELVAAIVQQLKPWTHTEQTAITHDVTGKPVWNSGTTRGLTPLVTVRFNEQQFKIYGTGSVKLDPTDPSKGVRLPNDAEIQRAVLGSSHLKTFTAAFTNLANQPNVTKEMLSQVDIAIVPGLAINVGNDMVQAAVKKDVDYFAVPEAYAVPGSTIPGHRESYIHVKPTRTNQMAVVDTNPAPGQKMGKLPLFTIEKERADFRNGRSANAVTSTAQNDQVQGRPLNRADALASAADDFGDAPAQPVAGQPQQARTAAPQQASHQPVKAEPATVVVAASTVPSHVAEQVPDQFYGEFGDDDFEHLADDLDVMEKLGQGLPTAFDQDVDAMLREADEVSARRHSPTFG